MAAQPITLLLDPVDSDATKACTVELYSKKLAWILGWP